MTTTDLTAGTSPTAVDDNYLRVYAIVENALAQVAALERAQRLASIKPFMPLHAYVDDAEYPEECKRCDLPRANRHHDVDGSGLLLPRNFLVRRA